MRKVVCILLLINCTLCFAQNLRITGAANFMMPDFEIGKNRELIPGASLFARFGLDLTENSKIGPSVFYQYQNNYAGDFTFHDQFAGIGLNYTRTKNRLFFGTDVCLTFWTGGNFVDAVALDKELGLLLNGFVGYTFAKSLGLELGLSYYPISHYSEFNSVLFAPYLGLSWDIKPPKTP